MSTPSPAFTPEVVLTEVPHAVVPYQVPSSLSTGDYLRLFTAYINSGIHAEVFLRAVQYPNPANRTLALRMHADLRDHLDSYPKEATVPPILIETACARRDTCPQTFPLTFNEILESDFTSSRSILPTFAQIEDLRPDPNLTPTEQIMSWRARMAFDDWQGFQYLRLKLMEYLKTTPAHLLKPADLRAVAASFLDCSKGQRGALGMSTENIGIKLEGVDTSGDDLPIINVMVKELANVIEAQCTSTESSEDGE